MATRSVHLANVNLCGACRYAAQVSAWPLALWGQPGAHVHVEAHSRGWERLKERRQSLAVLPVGLRLSMFSMSSNGPKCFQSQS